MAERGTDARPVVAVWRWTWLPGSETFIRNQMDAMAAWCPVAVGAAREASAVSEVTDQVVFENTLTGRVRRRCFWYVMRSRRVTQALRETDASVVHAHFAYDGFRVRAAARRLGIPLIVTLHGVDVTAHPRRSGPKGWLYRRNLRHLFKDANQILAVSEPIRAQAVAFGASPHKVRVVHIGVPLDTDTMCSRTTVSSVDNRFDLVFIGRLVEKKGVADLLHAASMTQRNLRVAIVGDGELRADLEELAAELGVQVTFFGHISPDQVHGVLAASAIYVAPSKTSSSGDTEGLPTVVMEASRAGLPVVAYAHSGIPEAVTDQTGVLVAEGDIRGLSGAIMRLLDDEDLRIAMGRAGRARIIDKFSITRCTEALERIYSEAVS